MHESVRFEISIIADALQSDIVAAGGRVGVCS